MTQTDISVNLGIELEFDSYFHGGDSLKRMRSAIDELTGAASRLKIEGAEAMDPAEIAWGQISTLKATTIADAMRKNFTDILSDYDGEIKATYAPRQNGLFAMQPIAHCTVRKDSVRLDRIELTMDDSKVRHGVDFKMTGEALQYAGALSLARARKRRDWNAVEISPHQIRGDLEQIRAILRERPEKPDLEYAL